LDVTPMRSNVRSASSPRTYHEYLHYSTDIQGTIRSMIPRAADRAHLERRLARSPVVLIVGPRQCGKTTLARTFVGAASENYFDLEDPLDLARLTEPHTALGSLTGLVVIDEVQRRPDLFPILRVLVDRADRPATFLVLGSAQPSALRQAAESLAGRLAVVEMGGFRLCDLGPDALDDLWFRGGFPRAWLALSDADASDWLADYTRTLVEQDLFALDVRLPSSALRRFLSMVAHYTGQTWRSADPARSLGISEHTVRRYLDLATDALLVRQLPPWFANVGKRQVKSPKVYVRDGGLANHLLGVHNRAALLRHPSSGAVWEGLVVEEVLRLVAPPEAYFWATHGGAELDLFLPAGARRVGVEVKRADAPTITPSMRSALVDLELDRLVVIYPGPRTYALSDRVVVMPATSFAEPTVALATLQGD
jgi:uncharacterized protein